MNLQQCSGGSYNGGEEEQGGGEARRVTIRVRPVYYGHLTLFFREIREILVAKKILSYRELLEQEKGPSLII
jgi:hypothetical protein